MRSHEGRPRLLFGVTIASTALAFLRGQLRHWADAGYDVHLLCGETGLESFAAAEGVTELHVVRAARSPSPRDPLTLARLIRLLRGVRPDVVVMGTPKMGVLGTIAARLAGVPTRVYLVHGYRAEGLTGPRARALRGLERTACRAATDVVAVSPSLRAKLLAEGVVTPRKVQVLGAGSANGVDLTRFRPPSKAEVTRARAELGVPPDSSVVAWVGRVTADKGLLEMPDVWARIAAEHPRAHLVVAGATETDDERGAAAIRALRDHDRVRVLGLVDRVEQVFHAADVLVLLSRREGLGMVGLEAAACGVPTVGYAATGVVDAVEDGVTGVLVPVGDTDAVWKAVSVLLADGDVRRELSAAGVARTTRLYSHDLVWSAWAELFRTRAGLSTNGGQR